MFFAAWAKGDGESAVDYAETEPADLNERKSALRAAFGSYASANEGGAIQRAKSVAINRPADIFRGRRKIFCPESEATGCSLLNPMRTDDANLLGLFARERDESAFSELARRHGGLIFHTALRRTGNHAMAEDVSQQVLCALARKAAQLALTTAGC
ncbi:hypothetical protein OKA05_20785 [Luteolibacter arcticus]|uniref:Uncharacterized protein n=1 Tax=Luteolibacter arcticus TaxID=1581411 RepID=A0ABT3GNB5_9BACT|nr:hypothetical protein [Luteolibacter arcticus]MCW1925011.1 hypothetical protein [Luteolibacter arcticus]